MAKQERVERPKQERTTEAQAAQLAEDDAAVAAAQEKAAPDLSDLDEFLDEVDGLLEDMEVLVNFRQKGGE